MSCLIWNEKASLAKETPKEFSATDFKFSALFKPKRPLLVSLRVFESFLVEIARISSGVGHFKRISFELAPKTSEKIFDIQGKLDLKVQ